MNKTTAVATQYGTLSDGRGPRAISRWIRASGGPRHSLDRLPRSLLLIAHGPPALSHIGLPLIVASLLCLADSARDLGNDEVCTWQVFASVSYEKITTSYSVPKNHIFTPC